MIAGHRPSAGGWARPIAAGAALLGLAWLLVLLQALPQAAAWGYDYEAYLNAASRLASEGTLYQPETLSGPFRPGPYGLYLYPPPLGVAMAPFTLLTLEAGTSLWFLLHVAALALACWLMPVRAIVRVLAFAIGALSFAVLRDVILGNVSVLLLVPLVGAWRWLDRPAGSVSLALALALRPTLGVLLAWQLSHRRWVALGWTVAAGLVLMLASLPFVGLEGYLDYVTVLRNLSDITGVERNVDLGSMVLALGWGEDAARVALFAGYAAAIVAIVLGSRRDREVGFMVTLTGSLLLAPLLWDHYLAALLLPAAFLAQRGRPIAILLPLLSWLPSESLPLIVLAATFLPLGAGDAAVAARSSPPAETLGRAAAGADAGISRV